MSSHFDANTSTASTPSRRPPVNQPQPHLARQKQVERAIRGAQDFLLSSQREEGHWCGELESNVTISCEYIFMCQMLKLHEEMKERGRSIATYLLGKQNVDGGWRIGFGLECDVSTSAEAYLALRILGVDAQHEALRKAEQFILHRGGLKQIRIFTRIFLAMFGLLPWATIPTIPPEFIFLPPSSPINTFALSSWARGTMVPLFIICHYRPVFSLENICLNHLWLNLDDKNASVSPPWLKTLFRHGAKAKTIFSTADIFLRIYEKFHIRAIRAKALKACTDYILQRQEESGDWGGIFPPMLFGMLALPLRGYSLTSPQLRKCLDALHRFGWEDEEGFRIQPCVSPVWDTVLAVIGVADSGVTNEEIKNSLARAMKWVAERQLLKEHGDWKIYRPKLAAGGWAFEYHNSWFPDVDDTAAVLLALLKQNPENALTQMVERAVAWILGMQNRDGGWAAFDADNDKDLLNDHPFCDMSSLCDPSSPDITGRVLEAMGIFENCLRVHSHLLEIRAAPLNEKWQSAIATARNRALIYLRHAQETQGSWFGRWGVNYIYGTSNVLCGLAQIKIEPEDPMIQRAITWLKQVQNGDGGWGESLVSYADKRGMGRGESSASQTAWALMALLAYLPPEDEAILNGVDWLLKHQTTAAPQRAFEGGVPVPMARGRTWNEEPFTGTGFPNHFYLRYHLYRHYFPLMALGRFASANS